MSKAALFDKLIRMRVAIERAQREIDHPLPYLGDALDALERAMLDAWPPEPRPEPYACLPEPALERVWMIALTTIAGVNELRLQQPSLRRPVHGSRSCPPECEPGSDEIARSIAAGHCP